MSHPIDRRRVLLAGAAGGLGAGTWPSLGLAQGAPIRIGNVASDTIRTCTPAISSAPATSSPATTG